MKRSASLEITPEPSKWIFLVSDYATFTLVLGRPDTQFGTLTDGNDTLTIAPAASTPEPSSLLLLGFGILALGRLPHGFRRFNYFYSALKLLL